MSDTATIRPAVQADVESILALMPRLADFNVPARRNPEHLWMSDADILRVWAKGDRPDCIVQVAEAQDGRIAGFSIVSLRPELLSHAPSSHLEAIAVAPGFERQGIGQRLLGAAERRARERGAESMTLHVFAVNDRARAMYEKAGFDGELVRYYKPLQSGD
ncbi:MAG: GNAT family N-acetyltransferase [Pseudomonadota bacterium]